MNKDIFTFSTDLIERVQKTSAAEASTQTPVQMASQAVQTLKQAIVELKAFCKTYQFTDTREEIRFFKEVKPVLVSQYLYQRQLWKTLLADSYRDTAQKKLAYTDALGRLHNFAQRNDDFYRYCLSGASYHDEYYFTRQPLAAKSVNQDDNFSTSHDMKLSKVFAHEMLREYFIRAIDKLQSLPSADYNLMEWTAPKTAAVELIYALQAAGAVNNGKTEIKQVVNNFERIFNISLGNFYRSYHDMAIRKGSRTTFLDSIRERLLQKLDEKDE